MTVTPYPGRRTVGILTAFGCALALSACAGSSDDDPDSGSTGGTSAVQTEGTFPQTVPTKFGDVTVDEQPTKVVALGWGDAETALSLGVQPVGASDWLDFGGDGVGPWMDGAYDSSPEIISTLEPEYEEIAALEPDLILDVRSSGDQDRYDKLSSIATTVGIPDGADSYLTPREEQVQMIATALGRPDAGETINKGYDDMVAGIREEHPEWAEKTASTVALSSAGWGAYIRGSERYDTLLDLGFQENKTLTDEEVADTGFSVKLSDETLSKADSDLVVAFAVGTTPEDVAGNSAWQRLSATKEGHSFAVPRDISSAYALGSPSAIEFAMKQLVPLLEDHTS